MQWYEIRTTVRNGNCGVPLSIMSVKTREVVNDIDILKVKALGRSLCCVNINGKCMHSQ